MRRKGGTASGWCKGLGTGATTGIVIATASFMVINRLLPLDVTFLGYERHELEIWTFHLIWIAAFAHAWIRPRFAWVEQCQAIGALSIAAVLLNWLTTGDHLARSLSHAHLWPVAGVDIMLLAVASGAFVVSRWLTTSKRHATSAVVSASRVRAAMREAAMLTMIFGTSYVAFSCFALRQAPALAGSRRGEGLLIYDQMASQDLRRLVPGRELHSVAGARRAKLRHTACGRRV